jgi:hypothetical protein
VELKQRQMTGQMPAATLGELCSFWDRAFINSAYWTLLGRAPDPEGEIHFLNQLRSGTSKLTILQNLRYSPEGHQRKPGLRGLDEALRKHRRNRLPLVGWLVRLINGAEGESRSERRGRAMENYLGAAYAGSLGDGDVNVGPGEVRPSLDANVADEMQTLDELRRRLVRIEASAKRIEGALRSRETQAGISLAASVGR